MAHEDHHRLRAHFHQTLSHAQQNRLDRHRQAKAEAKVETNVETKVETKVKAAKVKVKVKANHVMENASYGTDLGL